MPESKHYVVMEGVTDGHSDYTIQATGQIEKVEGRLGGVDVSKGNDVVSGSTVNGTVWEAADGYRIYGGIKSIDVENPDHVQIHTGEISGPPSGGTDNCEMVVRAEEIEFVSGQGIGEGALELQLEHDIRGGQSERSPRFKLRTGSIKTLNTSIDNFEVPRGAPQTKLLTTAVTEYEVQEDAFTGNQDAGSSSKEITLECGNPKTVSQNVTIGSDRGNPGEVKVHYTIDQL